MPTVETVTGPVDTAQLGRTLMHEHVFVLDQDALGAPEGWDEEARVADAVAKLRDLRSRGIDTIVDLTVIGLGRYVPRVRRVAEASGMQVVVATGVYSYNEVPHYFHTRDLVARGDAMADFFVRDIEDGIPGTGARAAVLKVATDQQGVTEGVERILKSTAKAHRRTGVPISTHTHALSQQGLHQQRVLEEEGVDLSRVVIGHSGDTTDLEYLEKLIANGSYIGMDRFGMDVICSFEDRVGTVASLCERGHAGRIVLSHDTSCHIDWMPQEAMHFFPRWHFTHISDEVLPALRERGVTDEQINQMMVENPRRIFEQRGGY